jgi:hypothetical protein
MAHVWQLARGHTSSTKGMNGLVKVQHREVRWNSDLPSMPTRKQAPLDWLFIS